MRSHVNTASNWLYVKIAIMLGVVGPGIHVVFHDFITLISLLTKSISSLRVLVCILR